MRGLIGYTGFVGSNIYNQQIFDRVYNSKNIEEIDSLEFDLLIVAGIPANKQLANMNPEKDLENIYDLFNHIKTCTVKEIVLISTIDVHSDNHYGKNRLIAENLIKDNFDNYHIIRLPALYGKGLKKNLLYDINHLAPSFLKEDIFNDLQNKVKINLLKYYHKEDGIYKLHSDSKELIINLIDVGFTSLQFTNIKSTFQFFNLNYIGYFIDFVLYNNIKEYEISSDPISVEDIISDDLKKLLSCDYNFVSYDTVFGVKWQSKNFIVNDIKRFLE